MSSTHTLILLAAASMLLLACSDDSAAGGGLTDVGRPDSDLEITFDLPGNSDLADTGADDDGSCQDDLLEPSSFARPVIVTGAIVLESLAICRFDDDWFRIDLDPGERVQVVLEASYRDGDLDLLLFSSELTLLVSSATTADEERVAYGTSEAQSVYLRVAGVEGAENDYALAFSLSRFGGECADDPEEPNDVPEEALLLDSDHELEGRICQSDADWFRVPLRAGDVLAARLDFEHALGDLDLRLFRDGDLASPIAESRGETNREHVAGGPFETATALLLEVTGFRGALNDYHLAVHALPPADAAIAVAGTVRYEDRPFTSEGFTGETVALPAPGLQVELVRDFDGAVVAEGAAALDGTYALAALGHSNEDYYVRALSAFAEPYEARVQNRTDDGLYAAVSETFAGDATDLLGSLDLLATAESPAGGAFNILDVVWRGFDFVATYTDETGPLLTYRWEPGRAFSCGSCYGNDTISLGGQLEDADEYDDDIILHEFGHYFQDNWSADDSPGGRHNGERLNPLLAYGEGMATFMSSMILDDPEYVDLYIDSLRLRNLETAAEDEAFYGTDGDLLTGDVSEYLVAAVMWDALDPPSDDEPFDQLQHDPADILSVFFDYLRSPQRPSVGVRGIDLADWLNGMACTYPESVAGLAASCVDDRQYPWDPEADVACEGKAVDALPVEIVDQGSALWLFGLSGAAELRVWVDEGQGWAIRALTCAGEPCSLEVEAAPERAVVVTGASAAGPVRTSWLGERARARLLGSYRVRDSARGPIWEFGR